MTLEGVGRIAGATVQKNVARAQQTPSGDEHFPDGSAYGRNEIIQLGGFLNIPRALKV
jgi:hypothetical protein